MCAGNDVKFYDCQEILEEYRDKVMSLYRIVCSQYKDAASISVF